jgi:hypothetical protein
MNEHQIEILLDSTQWQQVLLCEIRDLLAARLPVPVEVPEVDWLRKENADLRAELDRLRARVAELERNNATIDAIVGTLGKLALLANDARAVLEKRVDELEGK